MKSLRLHAFLPYRLSVLANRVSAQLAGIYAERFALTIPEWRVLAVLGEVEGVSADFVGEKTAMDRVMVSRAVAKLLAKRHLDRRFSAEDKRRSQLSLTPAGRAVYDRIVPLARRYERALVSVLDATDRAHLERILVRLEGRARILAERGDWAG